MIHLILIPLALVLHLKPAGCQQAQMVFEYNTNVTEYKHILFEKFLFKCSFYCLFNNNTHCEAHYNQNEPYVLEDLLISDTEEDHGLYSYSHIPRVNLASCTNAASNRTYPSSLCSSYPLPIVWTDNCTLTCEAFVENNNVVAYTWRLPTTENVNSLKTVLATIVKTWMINSVYKHQYKTNGNPVYLKSITDNNKKKNNISVLVILVSLCIACVAEAIIIRNKKNNNEQNSHTLSDQRSNKNNDKQNSHISSYQRSNKNNDEQNSHTLSDQPPFEVGKSANNSNIHSIYDNTLSQQIEIVYHLSLESFVNQLKDPQCEFINVVSEQVSKPTQPNFNDDCSDIEYDNISTNKQSYYFFLTYEML